MYALLTSQSGLPIVVSTQSKEYPHLVMAGYTEESTGRKKEMEDKEAEILEELYFGNFEYGMA